MASADEIDFLKKQVDELSSLLHDYQAKYPPLLETDRPTKPTSVTPPWHIDPKLVSPILTEYESTNQILMQEVEKYKNQYKSVQKHVDQLLAENDRLTSELENTLHERITPLNPVEIQADRELSALDNLQAQLRIISQEKDSCNDLLRAAQREVRRLEEELAELRTTNISDTHWNHLLDQHQQMKVKYTQTIADLNQEVRLAQEEARSLKREAESAEHQLTEYRKSVSHSTDKTQLQERGRLIQYEETCKQLEVQLDSKSRECAELQVDLDKLYQLVDEQLDHIKRLAHLCGEKEAELVDSAERVKEAIATTEQAVLDKAEMSLSIKSYQSEIDRLKEELTILCDKAAKKTKDEVDKVQKYNDIKINKLNETIHSLETEVSALKAELERGVREKRSVEGELEKAYKEGAQKAWEEGGRYDQLSKRACDAERDRDELKIKLCTTEAELKRTEMKMANDKLTLTKQVDRLTERVRDLESDFNQVNTDRLKHLEEANAAEELANSVKRDAEASARKHNKEMICLEHSIGVKQTEFECKLRTIEESHRKVLNKLREDMTSQQRSANQWKEEYTLISDKYEKTIESLRTEVSSKETRLNELTLLLREAKDKTVEAESMVREYTNQMRKIELRTKEAERRTGEAMQMNANKDRKIKQLLMERQQMAASVKHLNDPLLMEGTFRMSEIHQDGDTSSNGVLGEISLNRQSAHRGVGSPTKDDIPHYEYSSTNLY